MARGVLFELPLAGILDADKDAQEAEILEEQQVLPVFGASDDPRRVDTVVPMENRANKLHALDPAAYPRTGRMYFDIDSMKFQKEIDRGEKEGRPVKVLYHSHLDVGAYFSDTDAQVAKMGGDEPPFDLAYLVTSVQKGTVDDHKLFVWDTARRAFVESTLEIREAG